jgi:hypothetical protein
LKCLCYKLLAASNIRSITIGSDRKYHAASRASAVSCSFLNYSLPHGAWRCQPQPEYHHICSSSAQQEKKTEKPHSPGYNKAHHTPFSMLSIAVLLLALLGANHATQAVSTRQHRAPMNIRADSSAGQDPTSPIRRSVPPRLADRQIGLQQYRSTRRKNHRKRNPLPLLQPAPRREHCSRRQLLHLLRHRQQHALVFQRHQPVRAKWRLPPARNLSQRLHSRC